MSLCRRHLLNLAFSQAGVRGTITRQIGTFVETTKKGTAKAHHCIFEMHINEIMKKWPEKKKRERRWVSVLYELILDGNGHDDNQ
jgi:hypothetical protein